MKRLLLLPLLLGLSAPVLADLGEAEIAVEKTSIKAWCGKRRNKCTVTFEGNRMQVNDGKGITSDQILEYWSGG